VDQAAGAFFNEVLAAGNLRLAAVFVPKCTGLSVRDRVDMWLKCNMVGKAAEEAGRAKDMQALLELRTKAADRDAGEVERWINLLQKKVVLGL
jgi:vacuolar protein sorting-associated protein 16